MQAHDPVNFDRPASMYSSWCSSSVSRSESPENTIPSPCPLATTPVDQRLPSILRKIHKWASTPAMGRPVWPSLFIPMKSPLTEVLAESYLSGEPCAHPHNIPIMLQSAEQQGHTIGLVINLSVYHDLYAGDLHGHHLQMRHVPLMSKNLPTAEAVQEVIGHAKQFWRDNAGSCIAIHCAYGYNRTGFIICCYLIEVCGLSVEAALASFAHSRPDGIRHEDFLEGLQARYAGLPPAPISAFCATPVYDTFYSSLKAGATQLHDLHTAAGWAEGAWEVFIAEGRHVQSGCMAIDPVHRASVATNDSHNDFEGLLIEESAAATVSC
eukprot:jgi/Ulvmu1/6164/UM028_0020.1